MLNLVEPCWTLLNLVEPCWTLLNLTKPYWTSLNLFESNWTLLNLAEHFWETLNLFELIETHWILLNVIEPCCQTGQTLWISKVQMFRNLLMEMSCTLISVTLKYMTVKIVGFSITKILGKLTIWMIMNSQETISKLLFSYQGWISNDVTYSFCAKLSQE